MSRRLSRGLSLNAADALRAKESVSVFHVLETDASFTKGRVAYHQEFCLSLGLMSSALGVFVGTLRVCHLSLCQSGVVNGLAEGLHM